MAELAWPPPQWTTHRELNLADANTIALGDYLVKIRKALEPAGLADASIAAVGEDGFGVITPMEQIDERSLPAGTRFGVDDAGRVGKPRTVLEYLDVLLNLKPGRFRAFLFLVTPRPIQHDAGPGPQWSKVRELKQRAATHLPAELAERKPAPGTHTTVLVYEFERRSLDDAPSIVVDSHVSAARHLASAGIRGL
jgi:hypothetical protein